MMGVPRIKSSLLADICSQHHSVLKIGTYNLVFRRVDVHLVDFAESLRGQMDGRSERCQRFIHDQIRDHLSNLGGRVIGKQICAGS
jgi:hypothetical protein